MPKNDLTSVVKLQLEVGKEDGEALDGQSRICNWLYNQLLERANELREEFLQTQNAEVARTLYTERGLRNLVPQMKQTHPFLKVAHSSPLKNAALRCSAAIQSYQKSRKGKRKGKSGWPRFRAWSHNWFSLLYDEPNKGFKVCEDRLILSMGRGMEGPSRRVEVKLKDGALVKNKDIRNLRIVKQLGVFYAVFTVRAVQPELKPIKSAVALDPNHKNLAYGVDTNSQAIEISAPSYLKKLDRRIDELCRKRDCCKRRSQKIQIQTHGGQSESFYWKPSRRWLLYDRKLEKLRRKRREQTKTFQYTVAHVLCKKYDLVAIGDYAPDGSGLTTPMRRSMNNQSFIGGFRSILAWVAVKSGKHFYEFNEKGTTRTCHSCGHVIDGGLSPGIRTWTCPACEMSHIRDENAAQNGLFRCLRDLKLEKLVPGSGPAPVQERWAWRVRPSGVHITLRGPHSDLITAPRNSTEGVVAPDQNLLRKFS